ncbi:hypothetical protein WDJ51_10400 [Rathayibacter sp. YIM 133350]|uniref:hypothetical protein n=1 Tax=Rathayibacter sp. YIM 133350 TaxID=3131992 RepID=UPI00307D13D3
MQFSAGYLALSQHADDVRVSEIALHHRRSEQERLESEPEAPAEPARRRHHVRTHQHRHAAA